MNINPINTPISFGYSNQLKTLFKKGKLPIKYGFYGDELTKKNVSLEHLLPVSQGGKTTLSNLVLASRSKNSERGVTPLKEVITWDRISAYLIQFKDLKAKDFDGNNYISMVYNTLLGLMK